MEKLQRISKKRWIIWKEQKGRSNTIVEAAYQQRLEEERRKPIAEVSDLLYRRRCQGGAEGFS
ncbi:hypothetical protein Leryth_016657 [Lithospermum erythrorhizon]|nr:hypothetical protein Leryth_016657 [Lithospermum erythrorhizon]